MAKDTRKINQSVRLSKERGVFSSGKEDELEAVASTAEIKSLTERGLIEGFHGNKTEKAPEKAPEKTK
jgi:hypothetical protein